MDITQRLIDFAEAGNQQKIILVNGQVLQGWIMEINEEALLISTGFGDKTGKDIWIKLGDLTQAQLSYWDNHNDIWQPFVL